MKQHINLKKLFISAAAALGLAVAGARAGGLDEPALTSTTEVGQGLLGQQYASLTYAYIDLDDVSTHADDYTFAFNQPLRAGLDAVFSYDYTQSGLVAGSRLKQHAVMAGLRAFGNRFAWGKPYAEAGIGYARQKFGGASDNSFVWGVGFGAELQLAPAFSVTPFIDYTDAPDLAGNGVVTGGVKANYWIDSQWSVTAGIDRDDSQNNAFTVGTNFRF